MPKNDEAHEKKLAAAVNALMRFPGMKVHEAMDYGRFSKNVINDVNVRCVLSRRHFRAMEAATPPKNVFVNADTSSDVSSLSMDAGVAETNATTSVPINDNGDDGRGDDSDGRSDGGGGDSGR
jgi:hypothetical protein